jgi:hypothetical protein
MFKSNESEGEQDVRKKVREEKKEKGFLGWMKRVFRTNDTGERIKRANSIEKG